jgi:hypothetical protein
LPSKSCPCLSARRPRFTALKTELDDVFFSENEALVEGSLPLFLARMGWIFHSIRQLLGYDGLAALKGLVLKYIIITST